MKLCHVVAASLLATALPAWADQTTTPSASDKRIRFTDYDPYDVLTIWTRVGADTLVVFESGEKVLDLGGGDTDAWDIGVIKAGNGFMIKPKATSPNTSVHVVTDRRVYNLDLKLVPRNQGNFLTVWYRYPKEEAESRAAAQREQRTQQLLAAGPAAGRRNESYSAQGADDTAPEAAWDDGTKTYLRFAPNRTIPAVYYVAEDSKEHLANFTVSGATLQIDRVARKFVLRAGDLVTCIFNDAYDANGTPRATSTASPAVERVIKKGVRK
jgi:type IV secretion system protein VirB9